MSKNKNREKQTTIFWSEIRNCYICGLQTARLNGYCSTECEIKASKIPPDEEK